MKQLLVSIKSWVHHNRLDLGVVLLLLVIAGVPRLLDLGIFLTADEKNWIGRSYEFIRAFKDFRFNDMLQTTHPGVTTLWLSGFAVTLKMFLSHIPFSFRNLEHFVTAAQFPIALTITLTFPLIYWWLKRLLHSRLLATFASLLIALDPFLIGYSRVVHVDALLSHLLFLAVLSTLLYAQEQFSRQWLVISAVTTALSILTKAPAVFMLPFLLLAMALQLRTATPSRLWLQERLRDLIVWLLIIGLLFIIFWPAILWVPDPEGNLLLIKRDLSIAAVTPHHMIEDYSLNPLHYLYTLIIRTTPLAQLGLLAALVLTIASFITRRRSGHSTTPLTTLLTHPIASVTGQLVAYSFFFVVMMMIGAKKGDRYILPVWLALDVLAAIGLSGLVAMTVNAFFRRRQQIVIAAVIGIVLIASYSVFRHHPYAIAYSNPLFRDDLSQTLGWGEGLEQVGQWLNEHAPDAVVASWYPEELGAYTSAQVAHINAHEQSKIGYVVLYKNMFGRAPDHYANDFIDEYFKKRQPIFVAKVLGKEFAWVYPKRVYEQVVGELVPGFHVAQQIPVSSGQLMGFDVLPATYNGLATTGTLLVQVRQEQTGIILQEWRVPAKELEDNHWYQLKLSSPLTLTDTQNFFLELWAEGVTTKAPTIRWTKAHSYYSTNMVEINQGVIKPREGDLGLRARYLVGTESASEEDTKLLKSQ